MPTLRFADESSWEAFWHGSRRRLYASVSEHALSVVGEEMAAEGFRLFRNGGTPLLERRTGDFIEEVVLVPGPTVEGGVSVNVRVHVSCPRLRDFRERYWQPASLAPAIVAGGDLGMLQLPPAHLAFRLTTESDAQEVVHELRETALPWLEPFWNLTQLSAALEDRGYPLMTFAAGVELSTALFGPSEGMNLMRQHSDLGATIALAERLRLRRMALVYGMVRAGRSTALQLLRDP